MLNKKRRAEIRDLLSEDKLLLLWWSPRYNRVSSKHIVTRWQDTIGYRVYWSLCGCRAVQFTTTQYGQLQDVECKTCLRIAALAK